jgi:hypothetical protein
VEKKMIHGRWFTVLLMFVLVLGILCSAPVKKDNLSGIVFFQTEKLAELERFYIKKVGCTLWLDQGSCKIFKAGNMLFGFCRGEKADMDALLTFFYQTQKEVDEQYQTFKSTALSPPKTNMRYRIYHFFARDPEGRLIEFQHFLDPMKKI